MPFKPMPRPKMARRSNCTADSVSPVLRLYRGARYGTLGGGTSETLRDLIEDHGRGGYRR